MNIEKLKEALRRLRWGELLRRMVLSWLSAAMAEYLMLPEEMRALEGMEGLGEMSFLRVMVVTGLVFVCLTFLREELDISGLERWGIPGMFGVMTLLAMGANESEAFRIACVFLLGILVFSAVGKGAKGKLNETHFSLAATAVVSALFVYFTANWGVSRIRSFSVPSYDFGIFAQMFHNMRTTGLPVTTLERDGLLSHFHVHMSPIYYLMLPFYCLAPEPETLPVLQALVMGVAVIPLWLLGREHGLRPVERMLVCMVLLALPAFSGGVSYDLHENCFLTMLLLWLFYGIDRKNGWITGISALLTLMVKEDAAVYTAVVALWLLVRTLISEEDRKWGLRWSLIVLTASCVWFFASTWYLSNVGDGVMSSRYRNFIFDGSGSLAVMVKAVLMNPMKVLFESVDAEKLKYITYTMVPLLGIPLYTRRYERFLLLIPYVLVNLMSDYQYQHDFFFQYSFGSLACMVYLFTVNLADWKQDWKRITALAAALVVAGTLLGKEVIPKGIQYPEYCQEHEDLYEGKRLTLSAVPEGVSVAATTFLTTELSERAVLYDIRYADAEHVLSCEYVVIDVDEKGSLRLYEQEDKSGYENLVELLTGAGYVLEIRNGDLEIYRMRE